MSSTDRARAALGRGDVLIAYDEAVAVLDADPDDLQARFLAALALARAGAGERAIGAALALQEKIEGAPNAPEQLRQDTQALLARVAKDRALATSSPNRPELAGEAAGLYAAVAERYGGHYPFINAATLHLVAGDTARAAEMAERALAALPQEPDAYWRLATEAEAALVLGDTARARQALQQVADEGLGDAAARARTRFQLTLVCDITGQDQGLLAHLAVPSVLHFCGHRAVGDEVRPAVDAFLDNRRVGIAYGSLARGADIIIAEALLKRSVELHVVLPFAVEDFETVSVGLESPSWGRRYHRCLELAATVTCTCDSHHLEDDALLSHASAIAMGHAINRAAFLGADVEQLAVWDGLPATAAVGTARDVETWERSGQRSFVISVPSTRPAATAQARKSAGRIVAILFADFRGFSRLRDEHYASFITEILRPIAKEIDLFESQVLYRNTWGDAITLVMRDVITAARCGLGIQDLMATVDGHRAGLPADLGLRIALHAGRVMSIVDPIRGVDAFWGRELTRAARIEPRTPEGEVYATDAVAALLALEPSSGVRCEYMGRVTTAKDFETIPMYRLRRASS